MAGRSGMTLQGDKRLIRKLRSMNIDRKSALKALRPGTKQIQAAARQAVPVGTGNLKKSIKIKTLRGNPPTLAVRPQYRAQKNKQGDVTSAGFHAHLVEYGTGTRPAVKGGGTRKVTLNGQVVRISNTGEMPARPFMRPAWDRGHRGAMKSLEGELWKLVKQQAKGDK